MCKVLNLIALFLLFTFPGLLLGNDISGYCEQYLEKTYQKISVINLASAQEINLLKFMINYNHLSNSSHYSYLSFQDRSRLINLGQSFQVQFPDYKNLIEPELISYIGPVEFQSSFTQAFDLKTSNQYLIQLQKKSPKAFEKLENKYQINDLDLLTLESSKNKSVPVIKNNNLMGQLQQLETYNKNEIAKILKDSASHYKKQCSQKDYLSFLKKNKTSCPSDLLDKSLFDYELEDFSFLLRSKAFKEMTNPKIEPLPPIKIRQPFWPEEKMLKNSNEDVNAYYCVRDTNILTTVIIHHTAVLVPTTIEETNQYHIDNWVRTNQSRKKQGLPPLTKAQVAEAANYMVAYHYYIDAGSEIAQGRQDWMKGAHAGSDSALKREEEYAHVEKNLPKDEGLKCGTHAEHKAGKAWSSKEQLIKNGYIGANATSIGIAISGNFMNNSSLSLPSNQAIEQAAKLICHLQRKYPTIKTLGGHRQYHYVEKKTEVRDESCQLASDPKTGKKPYEDKVNMGLTSCPGNIMMQGLYKIKEKAAEYGCEFNVNPTWVQFDCYDSKSVSRE